MSGDAVSIDWAETLRSAQSGVENAIVAVLDAVRPRLCAMIHSMRVHPSNYEDYVQECLIVVLHAIEAYPDTSLPDDFPKYAASAAENRLIDIFRTRGRPSGHSPASLDCVPEPVARAPYRGMDALYADEAMSKISTPEKRQAIAALIGLGGIPALTPRQIAAVQKTSEAKVKRRIEEAFAEMRGAFGRC